VALSYMREVRLFIAQHLDPQASALAFAKEARSQVADMVAAHTIPPRFTQYVDGHEGAAFESVKPGGTIALSFTYNADILVFALAFLYSRSPTGPMPTSGPRLYRQPFRESFWVSINGKYIAPGALNLAHVPEGPAELIVGNLQPYARKVDVQRVGNRVLHFNKPAGLYDDAARAVNAQFGNVVTAKRVYNINFPGKYTIKQTQTRAGTHGRVKRWSGTPVESPALIINPR
jgi:hypothetical protein